MTDQLHEPRIADELLAPAPREAPVTEVAVIQEPATVMPSSESVIAMTPITPKQTFASPMSYVGITRRTTAWVRHVGQSGPVQAIFAWTAAVLFLIMMYAVLVVWYFVIFVIFGLLTLPYRIIRRSQRKQTALQAQQLATMQAMLVNQQRVLNQGGERR
jgi:hypothetical protein